MGVGTRLKEILSSRGMTIKELSDKTGISLNTLYNITKRDNDSIRLDNLSKIASALGVSIDELLGYGGGFGSGAGFGDGTGYGGGTGCGAGFGDGTGWDGGDEDTSALLESIERFINDENTDSSDTAKVSSNEFFEGAAGNYIIDTTETVKIVFLRDKADDKIKEYVIADDGTLTPLGVYKKKLDLIKEGDTDANPQVPE